MKHVNNLEHIFHVHAFITISFVQCCSRYPKRQVTNWVLVNFNLHALSSHSMKVGGYLPDVQVVILQYYWSHCFIS